MSERLSEAETALLQLGRALRERGYRFATPTPTTHATVNARPGNRMARSLTDVFGWSRAFEPGVLDESLGELASRADILGREEVGWRSLVRFSTLGDLIFIHSAFPGDDADSVFFGPDTYRFARLLSAEVEHWNLPARLRVVDIGCGSGAGGIHLAHRLAARADVSLVLADINFKATKYARVNAALNDCAATAVLSDVFRDIEGSADIIISNPPYLADGARRVYRHGGGELGEGLSVRIVEESLARLSPGGKLILYTGTAIVDGADTFRRAVEPALAASGHKYRYSEIDPDVFGEELREEAYANVDRIAVVAIIIA